MRKVWVIVATLVLGAGLTFEPGLAEFEDPTGALDGDGFAVLELYTSEGCSSCPAADSVLSDIATEYVSGSVLPLSFHVDYWNRLGWRDPFSNPAFSARQRQHAQSAATGRVYTPQLIINGKVELIGSRGSVVRALVGRALTKPRIPSASIELSAVARSRDIHVEHRVLRAPPDAKLSLLVVQRHARNWVASGENASRTLEHTNVVRSLTPAASNGQTRLQLPGDLSPNDTLVVGILEKSDRHTLLAAAKADVVSGVPILHSSPSALRPRALPFSASRRR